MAVHYIFQDGRRESELHFVGMKIKFSSYVVPAFVRMKMTFSEK